MYKLTNKTWRKQTIYVLLDLTRSCANDESSIAMQTREILDIECLPFVELPRLFTNNYIYCIHLNTWVGTETHGTCLDSKIKSRSNATRICNFISKKSKETPESRFKVNSYLQKEYLIQLQFVASHENFYCEHLWFTQFMNYVGLIFFLKIVEIKPSFDFIL